MRQSKLHTYLQRPRAAVVGLGLTLLAACATTVITPEVEDEWGAQMAQQVEAQMGLYRDIGLEGYVQAVGNRLASELEASPYRFRFAIVDQFEPNAFATPGGYIYVSRGLLAQMNSEQELAGVLAHEISHVTRRHHAKQAGKSLGAGLLTLPGKAVGVVSQDLGNLVNAPFAAAGQVLLASYSRGQETEADEYGMRLAARAGYEPTALADALQGIERQVEMLSGEQRKSSFFDSHPTTPTRVADVNRQAGAISRQLRPPLADPVQLYGHLDGLWWGPHNPQQGVFEEQVFRNADFDFSITFPQDWETVNTPSFVGASAPDDGAYIALGSNNRPESITEMADSLASKMRQDAGIEPSERRAFRLGDWPAEALRYDDNSGGEMISLHYVLVQSPREKFLLLAMGYAHHREALRDTALSLRPLAAAERTRIRGLRLRIAHPRGAESLEQLGQRVGNRWPPEFTRVINGLEAGAGASGAVKYVREETYVPGQ